MKRPIILGLTTLALIGLVGCSSSNNTKVESDNNQNTQIESSSEQTSNEENNIEAPINSDSTAYTGKVSNIVGNQVTIKLIDDDFELTDEMKSALGMVELSENQIKQLESGETIQLPGGGTMGMAVAGDANSSYDDQAISDEDLKEEGVDVEAEVAEERAKQQAIFNQIEFNGESKEITIPAGVEIINELTANSAKISDIKKGSIIDILIDNKTNTVTHVNIKF